MKSLLDQTNFSAQIDECTELHTVRIWFASGRLLSKSRQLHRGLLRTFQWVKVKASELRRRANCSRFSFVGFEWVDKYSIAYAIALSKQLVCVHQRGSNVTQTCNNICSQDGSHWWLYMVWLGYTLINTIYKKLDLFFLCKTHLKHKYGHSVGFTSIEI